MQKAKPAALVWFLTTMAMLVLGSTMIFSLIYASGITLVLVALSFIPRKNDKVQHTFELNGQEH